MRLRKLVLVGCFVAVFGNKINAQDAIDPSSIQVVGGSPDVRSWRATAAIRRVELTPTDFKVQADLPGWRHVTPPGWDGGIQYTLWIVVKKDGQWRTTGSIEFWSARSGVGGPLSDALRNWWYYAPEIGQPLPGETVGVFVAAGDQRRKDVRSVEERSTIVAFTVPPTESGTFDFASVATPSPPPVVTPPVVIPPPAPLPSLDLTAVFSRLDALAQQLSAHEASDVLQHAELRAAIDEPGWFTKVIKNPIVQMALAGIGTCAATRCWSPKQ